MPLTNNSEIIYHDFGKFPKNAHYNPHGIFYSPFPTHHKISLYLGTNCGLYYALQCEEKKCSGFGHQSRYCPYLQNIPRCYADLSEPIENLLKSGFQYQTVFNQDESCAYFDDQGEQIL